MKKTRKLKRIRYGSGIGILLQEMRDHDQDLRPMEPSVSVFDRFKPAGLVLRERTGHRGRVPGHEGQDPAHFL